MNTIVLRYLRSIPMLSKASFAKMNLLINPVTNDAIPITKITAPPIPAAVSVFFETPRKGQIPRNWLNTTLLTIAYVTAILNNVANVSITYLLPISFRLTIIGSIRELLGAASIFGVALGYTPISVFKAAPGAFIVLGALVAVMNIIRKKMDEKGKPLAKPSGCITGDCASCTSRCESSTVKEK